MSDSTLGKDSRGATLLQIAHTDAVSHMITDRDQRHLVSCGGDDGHVKLWDLHTSKLLQTIKTNCQVYRFIINFVLFNLVNIYARIISV